MSTKLGTVQYLRKVAVPEFEGITGEKTFVLESLNPDRLLQLFLPFLLSSETFHAYAVANSRGSVNPYLNWGELADYEFDLPPLGDQQRIADLLWAVEDHRRALHLTADHLAKARAQLLDAALVDGIAKGGWPVKPVPMLVTDGPRNGKSATANDEGRGIPTLSIGAVRGGQVHGGASVKYIDVPADAVQNFRLDRDDFLVVRGNGNKQLTARGGLVSDGLPEGCVYPDLLIRMRFDDRVILPAFAAAQWNSPHAHQRLLQNAKSTNGIWKINGQDIKSHTLITPPISAQKAILDQLDLVDRAATGVREQSAALESLRSSLLADVFGGV